MLTEIWTKEGLQKESHRKDHIKKSVQLKVVNFKIYLTQHFRVNFYDFKRFVEIII